MAWEEWRYSTGRYGLTRQRVRVTLAVHVPMPAPYPKELRQRVVNA